MVNAAGNVGIGSQPHTSNRLRVEALDDTLYADALAAGSGSSGTSQIFLRNSSNTPGTFSAIRFTDAGGRAGLLNFVYDSTNANQGGSWHFQTRQGNSVYKDVLIIENIQDGGNVIVNEGQLQTDKITSKSGASNDASIALGANLTVSTGGSEQVEIDNLGRVKLLGNAVVSDEDFKTYMQFNLDPAVVGEAYKDKNLMLRAGQSFMVVNSDATVRLVNNAVLKGAADDSAEVAFPSDGSFTVSTGGQERVKVEDAAATFNGQVQTDTITNKDGTVNSGIIEFGAQVTQRSDYYHDFKAANPARGINNLRMFDSADDTDAFFQITNYCSNYVSGTVFAVEPQGTVIANTKGHLAINSQGEGKEVRIGCGVSSSAAQELTIAPGDIRAFAGYVPQTDQSLVTKGWVTTNAIPIYAPDGKAVFNAGDFQNQVDWINQAGDTITPSANDVFYITANAASSETATVALFNGQAGKPKRGLHILNRIGDTARTNGHTILEQRSADSAGQVGTNPANALGVLSMNVDGWQHIRMSRGNVAIGETTTSYSTVKLNVSGEIISNSSFGVYLETTVIGADATEESARNFYGFTSTPRLEADISYLYHFRTYYASSPTPTKTVLVEENGFLADNKITPTCPKRIAFKAAMKPLNDADRSILVTSGSAPSEFGSEIRCNTFTTQAAASGDASIELGANLTVSTGGETRAVVRDGLGRAPATAAELNNSNIFTIEGTTPGTAAEPGYTGMSFVGRYAKGISGSIGVKQYYNEGTDNTNRLGAFVFSLRNPSSDSNPPADVLTIDTTAAIFNGQVQTPSVSGLADSDASIELGASATITSAATAVLKVNSTQDTSFIRMQGAAKPSWFVGPNGDTFNIAGGAGGNNQIVITPNDNVKITAELQTSRIVGYADPATNASIAFGAELLTTNHTPTQPNSIATRQFVLDQAGAAGLVPLGTPSDNTTPDSPEGSTLHDNFYLYVKGTTTWKKTALYPLDSSGGGSDFPIPQPGQNSGEVWDTVSFRSGSSIQSNKSAVCAIGNVFFLNNSWSVNGTDWYQVVWNYSGGQTANSYAVVSEECRSASWGNGVYCGQYGYSYDGQSWNLYNSASTKMYGNCFFWEGKHYGYGGRYIFDGEGLEINPNPNLTGSVGSRPQVKKSDTVLMALDLVQESGSWSRGPVKRWDGDMETGSWVEQGAGASDFLQACHGIAWDGFSDKWVFITNNKAYVQKTSGNYSKSNFDEVSLPTTSDWAELTHDGNRFVAVADTAGANVSIWSEDGLNWTLSTDLTNPGLINVAGFNGRVIGAGANTSSDDVICIVTGNPEQTSSVTTATLPLGTPVDTLSVAAADASPLARLETQADANGYFDEEIKKRAVVVTLTQDAYDAIPADEIDDSTPFT